MPPLDLSGTVVEIDSLVAGAYDALADGQLTFGEVVQLGGLLAGKVNLFVHLSGHQKQKVVLTVLERAFEKVVAEKLPAVPEAERDALRQRAELAAQFAKETLPAVLDLAVSAARGKLDLSKAKQTCGSLLQLLFACTSKPKVETPVPTQGPVDQEAKKDESAPESTKSGLDPVPEESDKVVEDRPASTESQSNSDQVETDVQ